MKPNVQNLIDELVRTQFSSVEIHSVTVDEDTDFEGDRILRVTVVFEPKAQLDPAKTTGLVRHMRSCLNEKADEHAFPIVAFRSLAEQKRLKSAAA